VNFPKEFDDILPYWNASWFLFAVGIASRGLEEFIGYRAVGFLFLLAVLVVGFFGRLGPVLFAAAVSALSWNFFFIPPKFTLAIGSPEDALMCATFFFVALVTGILANRVKNQEEINRVREARTNFLYEVMRDISRSQDRNDFLAKIVDRLSGVLIGQCHIFLKSAENEFEFPVGAETPELSIREREAAREALDTGKVTGWSTSSYDDLKSLYIPIKGNAETVGVFRYLPEQSLALSIDQENLVQTVCRQVGIALEQRIVQQRLLETEKLRESEKIHQTILNSISHELRTPLTVIIGSASALEQEPALTNESSRRLMTGELRKAGQRLNRVVENLLDMSRLSSNGLSIKREWHDISDLIGVSVSSIQETLEGRRLNIEVPAELPLVEMDFRLLEHALTNVLINALAYTPAGSAIEIHAVKNADSLSIVVDDNGPGILPEYLPHVFDKFFRVPGAPPGGTGLGLSIAKSILEFHEGSISVKNRSGGGAQFQLSLPLRTAPTPPKELHV
jgi:two-component system sensor histidine kinase KdpD